DIDGIVEPAQIPIRILAVDLLSDVHFREYRYAAVDTPLSLSLVRSPLSAGSSPGNGQRRTENGYSSTLSAGSTPDNGQRTTENGYSSPLSAGSTPDNGQRRAESGHSSPLSAGSSPGNGQRRTENGYSSLFRDDALIVPE